MKRRGFLKALAATPVAVALPTPKIASKAVGGTAVGAAALTANTIGQANTALGANALWTATTACVAVSIRDLHHWTHWPDSPMRRLAESTERQMEENMKTRLFKD